jgi:hypothetical protein
MIDPDLVCMKITNVPIDSRPAELCQFLKEWASKDGIEDLTYDRDGTYFVRFHSRRDKFELPLLINKRAFNRSRINAATIPASEYPGYTGSGLPRAPMLFQSEDCPIPFHPKEFRQSQPKGMPMGQPSYE